MKELSRKMPLFTESVIRHMTRISDECGAINLSQGFPDFDPPKPILDRLAQVAYEGPHQYSVTWGAENLRQAIAKNRTHQLGMPINPNENIVITCGSTEAMMASAL